MKNTITIALAILLITPSLARAQEKKSGWSTAGKVAVGAAAAYGAYKVYKNGKKLEAMEAEQAAANARAEQAQAQAAALQEQTQVNYPRLVRGDGTGDQAVFEVSAGACELWVNTYYTDQRWNRAFDTACESVPRTPELLSRTFDRNNDKCIKKLKYSTAEGVGTHTRDVYREPSECGFSGKGQTKYIVTEDEYKRAKCYEDYTEVSQENPEMVRHTKKAANMDKCGFRLVRNWYSIREHYSSKVSWNRECVAIEEYSAKYEDKVYTYKTAKAAEQKDCKIRTLAEMSFEEVAKEVQLLAAIRMSEKGADYGGRNLSSDEDAPRSPTAEENAATIEEQKRMGGAQGARSY